MHKFIVFYNFPYVGGNGIAILDGVLLVGRKRGKINQAFRAALLDVI